MVNINNLIKASEEANIPTYSTTGNSQYSFGIVYCSNGKRIRLSKSLLDELKIGDSISILPVPSEHCILIAKKLSSKSVSTCSVSKANRQIIYNAPLASAIIEMFDIDFGDKTSVSFSDIKIEEHEGNKIAVVNMPDFKED